MALVTLLGTGWVSRPGKIPPIAGLTRESATLLAKARHERNIDARIGLFLAAADKANQGISESDAEARTVYNAACAELAVLLQRPSAATLPATLVTPTG